MNVSFRLSLPFLFLALIAPAAYTNAQDLAVRLPPATKMVSAPTKASTKKRPQLDFSLGQQPAAFAALATYIDDNLHYPTLASDSGIEGAVTVLVEISATGKLTPVQVVAPLGFGCDEAVLELLRNMPNWQPATNYGVPVKTKRQLVIDFSLR